MQHATIKHSDQLVTAAANHFDFSTAGRVLVAMTTFARQQNGEWVCWPSKATLAELAGVTSRTVQTAIKQLSDSGLITVQSRLARSSIYRLNVELIIKPSQAVINALASIVTMTTSLAERVSTATSRLMAIREQYKQASEGRSTGSTPPRKKCSSPPSTREDLGDLPNKDLLTSKKRSEQRAVPAPAISSKAFNEKSQSAPFVESANAISINLTSSGIKLASLVDKLKALVAAKADTAERDQVWNELVAVKKTHHGLESKLASTGKPLSSLPFYASVMDKVSAAMAQIDSLAAVHGKGMAC